MQRIIRPKRKKNYRDMKKTMQRADRVAWPDTEITENFNFDTIHPDGTFRLEFKWFNDRWNCWVTLPSGEKRQAGVYPNVMNWDGYTDYGIVFMSSLDTINFNSLLLAEIYIIKWN